MSGASLDRTWVCGRGRVRSVRGGRPTSGADRRGPAMGITRRAWIPMPIDFFLVRADTRAREKGAASTGGGDPGRWPAQRGGGGGAGREAAVPAGGDSAGGMPASARRQARTGRGRECGRRAGFTEPHYFASRAVFFLELLGRPTGWKLHIMRGKRGAEMPPSTRWQDRQCQRQRVEELERSVRKVADVPVGVSQRLQHAAGLSQGASPRPRSARTNRRNRVTYGAPLRVAPPTRPGVRRRRRQRCDVAQPL